VPASYYALLEVEPEATTEELRQAFRTLSKRYHPDTTNLPLAEAAAAFQQLQQGYGVLSDPLSRQRYDAELLALRQMLSAQAALWPPSPLPFGRPVQGGTLRPLSGGEWLALLLLGFTLLLSLALGLGLAWLRGEV
jgi:curved DNA-binding protein CbpA